MARSLKNVLTSISTFLLDQKSGVKKSLPAAGRKALDFSWFGTFKNCCHYLFYPNHFQIILIF